MLLRVLDFFHQLFNLFAFSVADVEEADSYCVAIMNGLHHATEAEGQAFNVELCLDARINAYREALIATDAAAAEADVYDSADEPRADFYKDDGGGVIDR